MTQAQESDPRIQAILASGIKIPPMPQVLLSLNGLLNDADAGPVELAELIHGDGALSGAVFRVVGSPVFGLHTRVTSLPHAISMLGMKNTAALLHSEILRSSLHDAQHAAALNRLWQRSTAIAEICVIATRKTRQQDIGSDKAFLIGMFHDCGLALLCKRSPVHAAALAGSANWPDILELDQSQNLSHAIMGQMVARNWALPDDLVEAIRQHHNPSAGDLASIPFRLCALLNLSLHLYNEQHAQDDHEWEVIWHGETLRRLEVDAEQLAEWEAQIRQEVFPV
jgi:HD-like signal output (HDOD) protein